MPNHEVIERVLHKRLKGFHKDFRGRFLLIINKILTEYEYVLWDFSFFVLADWDKINHPEIYGSFDYSFSDIDIMLGWGLSKTSRLSIKLFTIGLWEKRSDQRIKVCGTEILNNLAEITKSDGVVDLQKYIAKVQAPIVKTQPKIAEMQEVFSKENKTKEAKTIVNLQELHSKESLSFSSKGNSKFGSGGLPEDDMEWIKENLKE